MDASRAPLRVVTFNIAHARAIDRALEVLREATPLRGADVLALQEMDAPSVERIARELRLNSLFTPGGVHPRTGRDFGCAILSPWPLVEPRKVVLPHAARVTRLRRAAVGATLLRGRQRVRVYSVHLGPPLAVSRGSRSDQLQAILADASGSPDPVVLAGDFNSHGIGQEVVAAGYAWVTRDVGVTTRFLFFGFSFDHVFARGLEPAADAVAFGVIEDARGASDHRPVWAVLVPPSGRSGGDAEGGPSTSTGRAYRERGRREEGVPAGASLPRGGPRRPIRGRRCTARRAGGMRRAVRPVTARPDDRPRAASPVNPVC